MSGLWVIGPLLAHCWRAGLLAARSRYDGEAIWLGTGKSLAFVVRNQNKMAVEAQGRLEHQYGHDCACPESGLPLSRSVVQPGESA